MMTSFFQNRSLMTGLLVLSLLFNVGFLGAFVAKLLKPSGPDEIEAIVRVDEDLFNELDLTPEQRKAMEADRDALKAWITEEELRLHEERSKLADLMAGSSPDTVKVIARMEAIETIQRDIQRRVVLHLLHQKGVLKPHQCSTYGSIVRKLCCPDSCSMNKDHGEHASECGTHTDNDEKPVQDDRDDHTTKGD